MSYLRANALACVLGLAAAIFLVISVVQSVKLDGFLWIKGANDKLADCARDRNELRAITTKKAEQKSKTGRNIKKAETIRDKADGEARKIEQAPPAKDCATPPEIMGADL